MRIIDVRLSRKLTIALVKQSVDLFRKNVHNDIYITNIM